ncbi:MAG: type 2 lanthipeptide synthetase LanM family protein [Acidobacteriota bacterium]
MPQPECLPDEAVEAAREQAEQWREATALGEEDFERRLADCELDHEALVRLLAARDAGRAPQPRSGVAFDWLDVLEEIRLGTAADVELPMRHWINPDGGKSAAPPFASFIRPFLQVSMKRWLAGLREVEHETPLLAKKATQDLYLELIMRLVKECSSTLILELNIARLEGRLEGDTAVERFRYFSERSFTPEKVLATFDDYALLGRSMATTVLHWVAAMNELCRRLADDRELLRALWGGFGTVQSIELGISDPHCRGRVVAILEDDAGRKVVYKPTPLGVDRRLAELIQGINALGLKHALGFVHVLDRGGYGWQRFVAAESCRSIDELRRFYWRQGALLALLHLVRAADVHHENLIACGEHPILIDNEALFQHGRNVETGPESLRHARKTMNSSVLRQAVLPFINRQTARGDGLDSSGLGGAAGQTVQGTVRRWVDPATDIMRVEEADLVSREAHNRPALDGEPADATEHVDDLIDGFRAAYDLLAAHAEEIRPLLDAFRGTSVRHLLRSTRIYSVFLRESRHPNDLRDGLERDQLFDRLWMATARSPALARAVPFEQADLRIGDVPAFFTRPESVDLWSSDGTRIEGFFADSSLADSHRILDETGTEERRRQEVLIRLAIDEARSREHGEPQPLHRASGDGEPPPLLETAALVRARLETRALEVEGLAHWVSLDPFVGDTPHGDQKRNVKLTGSDLYHGTAGISLFLALFGELTNDATATDLARATLRSMLEARTASPPSLPMLGAFTGRGGYLYTLLYLATLWDEPELLQEAQADLPLLESLIGDDDELDLLSGSAGLILPALAIARASGDDAALDVARACGDHLAERVVETDLGPAWIGSSFDRPVVGFSHGTAGIAWVLLELAEATGEARYRDLALASIEAERRFLASEQGEGFHSRTSWCHGLPSVALGRLLALRHLEEEPAIAEIEAGIERLLEAGPPADCCLCHGVLGNAEILSLAGRRLGVESWCRTADAWTAVAANEARSLERRSHAPLWGRFAGLMCGLAGVGWGLLRSAAPERVPSVLALELPVAGGQKAEGGGSRKPGQRGDANSCPVPE